MGNKLENIAETLDLSKRSSSPRMDEFGRAAIAFDALMTRVLETVYAVRVSADTVARATRELVSGNVDISGYFKSGVANAAHEACGLKPEKSSLPAIRNSTVRMVLKLAYPRALRLAA